MKKEIIKIVGGWCVNIAAYSFGNLKGWMRARKKLKDDNKRIIDMLDD